MWVSCGVVQMEDSNIEILDCVQITRSGRLKAMMVVCAAIFLLGLAACLQPESQGIGTHQQLGLPQCGWILAVNIPCPTCGMTTAWSHAVRGELPSAFLAQPMGMLLAISTVVIASGALFSVLTGYSFNALLYRFSPWKVFIVVVILTLASWGFKILLHRDFL